MPPAVLNPKTMFVLIGVNGKIMGVFTAMKLAAFLQPKHLACTVEFWEGTNMKPVDITRLAGRSMDNQLAYLSQFYITEEKPLPL